VGYDIATNPLVPASRRIEDLRGHIERIERAAASHPDAVVVRSVREMDAARAAGRVGLWLAVQGGNALQADPDALDGPLGDALHRVTLVHLTSSPIGGSNTPGAADAGLGAQGRRLVENCVRRRVLVDLSHAGRKTFDDAVDQIGRAAPPVVTHTGASAVRPLWRNLDDTQIRAIADRGGFVGVIAHGPFLVPGLRCARLSDLCDHIEAVARAGGDEVVALGTDFDGSILPPWDFPDCTALPALWTALSRRGWTEARLAGLLGGNVRRVLLSLRP
jgi:membrane dipeptidase